MPSPGLTRRSSATPHSPRRSLPSSPHPHPHPNPDPGPDHLESALTLSPDPDPSSSPHPHPFPQALFSPEAAVANTARQPARAPPPFVHPWDHAAPQNPNRRNAAHRQQAWGEGGEGGAARAAREAEYARANQRRSAADAAREGARAPLGRAPPSGSLSHRSGASMGHLERDLAEEIDLEIDLGQARQATGTGAAAVYGEARRGAHGEGQAGEGAREARARVERQGTVVDAVGQERGGQQRGGGPGAGAAQGRGGVGGGAGGAAGAREAPEEDQLRLALKQINHGLGCEVRLYLPWSHLPWLYLPWLYLPWLHLLWLHLLWLHLLWPHLPWLDPPWLPACLPVRCASEDGRKVVTLPIYHPSRCGVPRCCPLRNGSRWGSRSSSLPRDRSR